MKTYLEKFFKKFDYPENDVAILINAYDKIIADSSTEKLWEKAIKMYEEDIKCDFREIIAIADDVALKVCLKEYTVNLLMLICLSRRTEQAYKEHNISEEIFYNSMCDLKYKLKECKLVKGITGTFVAMWFGGFYNLTRFGLGRLQFEVINYNGYYNKNGRILTPESKVINIHIPRTETPLDEESCTDAFNRAKEFFKDEVEGKCVFVCSCWLLYPENKKILPKHTNIYKFMERFEIVESGVLKDDNNLWRLFDTEEKNFNKLPSDSSVRRTYIEHLKNGGKTGWGKGLLFYDI